MKDRKVSRESETSNSRRSDWVVGIGASAGGLEALTTLITNLPEDFEVPIIIAQHLAPHAKSMMVELLQRHSKIPVVAASNRQPIETRTIYVAPPNHDIDLIDHHIFLSLAGNETRPKPSIDEFFTSIASAYGPRSIGIILSGTGTDGSDGVKAIKSAGGHTMAQDDQTAKYDGMPRSAVNTGDVDSILSPDAIARALPQILRDHETHLKFSNLDKKSLDKIFKLIKEKQGTDFSQYKSSTINRRIAKQMVAAGMKSVGQYYDYLSDSPAALNELCQEMLISVTSFFRDPEVFVALGPSIQKIVGQKKVGDEVRVWIAGCASGEEAYTIAMMFAESMERQKKHLLLKVFATDLDQDALIEARNGIYSESDCANVPLDFLDKYFQRRNNGYEVNKRLREIVVFARQDLTQNPPFVKLDLISCRNVLIYFEQSLQKKVIEIFHYALNPSGILLLGKSETVAIVSNLFDTVDRIRKIFSKLNVPSKLVPNAKASTVMPPEHPLRSRPAMGPTIAELSYLKLLNAYGISGVTVDEHCNIIQIIGDVSPYLGFFTPQPDFRLTNLLPKGVGVEIPIMIRKAAKDGRVHRSRAYKSPKGQKNETFYINVRTLDSDTDSDDSKKRLFVISFELKKRAKLEKSSSLLENELPNRITELEQELFVTREHLQTVVEELGVSNEELQSLNEELSSTNEELQASSEELETANEELQSSNEELTTVNEELNTKQSELRSLNLSFENVQNSLGAPMVILDDKRRILRFNPEATKVFSITNSDIGRDITRVSSNFENADFAERMSEAVRTGRKLEMRVTIGNHIYQFRILPCFDERRSITGLILMFIDNTELFRAQEKVAISEHRLNAIINGSHNIIFLKDNMGRYLLVNEAFKRFFGLTEEQVLGKTDREIFTDAMAVLLRDSDLEVLVTRIPTQKEEYFINPDGKKFWFLSSRFPLMDLSGQAPYAIGTVSMDITPQVETQRELHKSESRYRAIVEDQSVFVCRHNNEGKITFVNSAYYNQFGGSADLNLGQPYYRIIPDQERKRIAAEIKSISPSQPIVQYEHSTVDSRGQTRWVKWIHRGIFDGDGNTVEYQAVGFDITDSKMKTDQLLERDALFSSVFDHTSDFMSVIRVEREEFLLESFNRSASRILGQTALHLIGSNVRDMLDPAAAEGVIARYRQCAINRKPVVFEERMDIPGGVRFLSTTLVPIPGTDGTVERIASISRDISNYKRAELDLKRSKEEAEAANKSKSDFLASMSHELRTPLNVVLGMSQLLSDTHLNPEQKNYLASIKRSGDVLLTLIEDVLDVAKIEAGSIKLEAVAFNPSEVIDEVLALFRYQALEKNIQLNCQMDEGTHRLVIGDPARLRQILVNLVGNAVKFTDRGSVNIHVISKYDTLSNDNALTFTVNDTGIGIAEEDHERLFRRFSQVDSGNSRKYGGTGLGLIISKQLVNMMSGSIGFDSKKGKGSTFWFTIHLPVSKHSGPVAKIKKEETKADLFEDSNVSLKILAVDDSPDSRALIGLFLQKLGHKVHLAENAQEALKTLVKEDIDIVLMDIQMPGMDGYEATARIRSLPDGKSKLPIIALTANAMTGDSDRAFQAGMDDYITKPLEVSALKKLLHKWIKRIYVEHEKA